MRLDHLDLNLFVVFDAIYTERNLTRAAEVLHVTQPAISNALNRLRDSLNDPLFERRPQGMVPTPYAENIIVQVREALRLLRNSSAEMSEFDAKTAQRTFNFSMTDIAETALLPNLLQTLRIDAPGIALNSFHVARQNLAGELSAGKLDFAIDAPIVSDPNLHHQPLMQERYVCFIRDQHPLANDKLSMQAYLQLKHIHVSSRRRGVGQVDAALAALGLERDIQLRVSHYLVATQIVSQSDLALTVPVRAAQQTRLRLLELPFAMPALNWHLYWHKRSEVDKAHQWMRQALIDCAT